MATSNKTNVSKRSDKDTPLSQNEVDQNFQEIRNVIDDVTQLEIEHDDYVTANDNRLTTLENEVDTVVATVGSLDLVASGVNGSDLGIKVKDTNGTSRLVARFNSDGSVEFLGGATFNSGVL